MAESYVQLMRNKFPGEAFSAEIESLRRKIGDSHANDDDESVPNAKRSKISDDCHPFQCSVCGKHYRLKNSFNRHFAGHTQRFECKYCDKTYNRQYSLTEHCKRKHGLFGGGGVHKVITTVDNRIDAKKHIQNPTEMAVNSSDREFSSGIKSKQLLHNDSNRKDQETHIETPTEMPDHSLNKESSPNTKSKKLLNKDSSEMSAFQRNVVTKRFISQEMDKYDLLKFFAALKDVIKAYIISFGTDKRGVRFFMNTRVEMFREKDDGSFETTTPHFRSKTYVYLTREEENDQNLFHYLNESFQRMYASFEEFVKRGSGWDLKKVLYLDLTCATYDPLRGSTYIQEPQTLRKTNALVNVKNSDEKCFMYSILAHLHPVLHNPCRVQHYMDYQTELDFTNIPFPVPITKITHFEKLNGISVNVFGFENGEIFPVRITKLLVARTHVNLLYLTNGEKSHYVLIKNLNKFLHRTVGYSCTKRYFCPLCLQGFTKQSIQENHTNVCKKHDAQKVEYPEKGIDDILQFENFNKQLRCPFVIYADFETLNKSIVDDHEQSNGITKTARLEPCAFGYKVVSSCPKYSKETVIYKGADASKKFLDYMLEEEKWISNILSHPQPMTMNENDRVTFQNATHCHICGTEFTSNITKCRDHDHLSGKFRGAACQACNLNFQNPNFIPIFFHGLSNFDGSILCQSIGKFKKENITVIPRNTEKYISFSLGKLRFLDSYRFLSCSLEKLVENMKQKGEEEFIYFNKEFTNAEERKLLLRKGIFPYDYLDCIKKFDEKTLPPKEKFYNKLTGSHITEENYSHALKVWKTLQLENFGQYLDIYLRCDVLFLCDIFEKFRDMCLSYYQLDPAHYFTSPNLAWDACLKMTGVQLELLSDPDQHLVFEQGIRGGVAMVSKRYCKANHPGLGENYDKDKPHNYILYLDANNLYGWSMSQYLPVGNFKWLNDDEKDKFNIDSIPSNGQKGYMLEVTLDYDHSLHDDHNDFPLAPEKKIVMDHELSPYCRDLYKTLNPSKFHGTGCDSKLANRPKIEKLIPTLSRKENYVVHYRTLQLYLQLGLKLLTVHRVLEFDQRQWLKPYIDFNTDKRKSAKNEFEKDFFKLMNNAVFGKTMENLRLRQDVRLVHRAKIFKKLVAKSSFDSCKIFNEDLAAVCLKKQTIKMIRPIYTGAIILDLSKLLMYDFYYNTLKQQYGDKVSLIYTDTDSFILDIQTSDIQEDMMKHLDLFDTSNYPKHHPLYSNINAKVLGKMKDESGGKFIAEVVALRPKMYSYIIESTETKKAKGISKAVVQNHLRHVHYKKSLIQNASSRCTMTLIRSELHKLYTVEMSKTGLSAFEDKRYILENGVDSYAFGHYRIPTTRN